MHTPRRAVDKEYIFNTNMRLKQYGYCPNIDVMKTKNPAEHNVDVYV